MASEPASPKPLRSNTNSIKSIKSPCSRVSVLSSMAVDRASQALTGNRGDVYADRREKPSKHIYNCICKASSISSRRSGDSEFSTQDIQEEYHPYIWKENERQQQQHLQLSRDRSKWVVMSFKCTCKIYEREKSKKLTKGTTSDSPHNSNDTQHRNSRHNSRGDIFCADTAYLSFAHSSNSVPIPSSCLISSGTSRDTRVYIPCHVSRRRDKKSATYSSYSFMCGCGVENSKTCIMYDLPKQKKKSRSKSEEAVCKSNSNSNRFWGSRNSYPHIDVSKSLRCTWSSSCSISSSQLLRPNNSLSLRSSRDMCIYNTNRNSSSKCSSRNSENKSIRDNHNEDNGSRNGDSCSLHINGTLCVRPPHRRVLPPQTCCNIFSSSNSSSKEARDAWRRDTYNVRFFSSKDGGLYTDCFSNNRSSSLSGRDCIYHHNQCGRCNSKAPPTRQRGRSFLKRRCISRDSVDGNLGSMPHGRYESSRSYHPSCPNICINSGHYNNRYTEEITSSNCCRKTQLSRTPGDTHNSNNNIVVGVGAGYTEYSSKHASSDISNCKCHATALAISDGHYLPAGFPHQRNAADGLTEISAYYCSSINASSSSNNAFSNSGSAPTTSSIALSSSSSDNALSSSKTDDPSCISSTASSNNNTAPSSSNSKAFNSSSRKYPTSSSRDSPNSSSNALSISCSDAPSSSNNTPSSSNNAPSSSNNVPSSSNNAPGSSNNVPSSSNNAPSSSNNVPSSSNNASSSSSDSLSSSGNGPSSSDNASSSRSKSIDPSNSSDALRNSSAAFNSSDNASSSSSRSRENDKSDKCSSNCKGSNGCHCISSTRCLESPTWDRPFIICSSYVSESRPSSCWNACRSIYLYLSSRDKSGCDDSCSSVIKSTSSSRESVYCTTYTSDRENLCIRRTSSSRFREWAGTRRSSTCRNCKTCGDQGMDLESSSSHISIQPCQTSSISDSACKYMYCTHSKSRIPASCLGTATPALTILDHIPNKKAWLRSCSKKGEEKGENSSSRHRGDSISSSRTEMSRDRDSRCCQRYCRSVSSSSSKHSSSKHSDIKHSSREHSSSMDSRSMDGSSMDSSTTHSSSMHSSGKNNNSMHSSTVRSSSMDSSSMQNSSSTHSSSTRSSSKYSSSKYSSSKYSSSKYSSSKYSSSRDSSSKHSSSMHSTNRKKCSRRRHTGHTVLCSSRESTLHSSIEDRDSSREYNADNSGRTNVPPYITSQCHLESSNETSKTACVWKNSNRSYSRSCNSNNNCDSRSFTLHTRRSCNIFKGGTQASEVKLCGRFASKNMFLPHFSDCLRIKHRLLYALLLFLILIVDSYSFQISLPSSPSPLEGNPLEQQKASHLRAGASGFSTSSLEAKQQQPAAIHSHIPNYVSGSTVYPAASDMSITGFTNAPNHSSSSSSSSSASSALPTRSSITPLRSSSSMSFVSSESSSSSSVHPKLDMTPASSISSAVPIAAAGSSVSSLQQVASPVPALSRDAAAIPAAVATNSTAAAVACIEPSSTIKPEEYTFEQVPDEQLLPSLFAFNSPLLPPFPSSSSSFFSSSSATSPSFSSIISGSLPTITSLPNAAECPCDVAATVMDSASAKFRAAASTASPPTPCACVHSKNSLPLSAPRPLHPAIYPISATKPVPPSFSSYSLAASSSSSSSVSSSSFSSAYPSSSSFLPASSVASPSSLAEGISTSTFSSAVPSESVAGTESPSDCTRVRDLSGNKGRKVSLRKKQRQQRSPQPVAVFSELRKSRVILPSVQTAYHYAQHKILPPRTWPPLVNIESFPTISMYEELIEMPISSAVLHRISPEETTQQLQQLQQQHTLSPTHPIQRYPVLEPTPWLLDSEILVDSALPFPTIDRQAEVDKVFQTLAMVILDHMSMQLQQVMEALAARPVVSGVVTPQMPSPSADEYEVLQKEVQQEIPEQVREQKEEGEVEEKELRGEERQSEQQKLLTREQQQQARDVELQLARQQRENELFQRLEKQMKQQIQEYQKQQKEKKQQQEEEEKRAREQEIEKSQEEERVREEQQEREIEQQKDEQLFQKLEQHMRQQLQQRLRQREEEEQAQEEQQKQRPGVEEQLQQEVQERGEQDTLAEKQKEQGEAKTAEQQGEVTQAQQPVQPSEEVLPKVREQQQTQEEEKEQVDRPFRELEGQMSQHLQQQQPEANAKSQPQQQQMQEQKKQIVQRPEEQKKRIQEQQKVQEREQQGVQQRRGEQKRIQGQQKEEEGKQRISQGIEATEQKVKAQQQALQPEQPEVEERRKEQQQEVLREQKEEQTPEQQVVQDVLQQKLLPQVEEKTKEQQEQQEQEGGEIRQRVAEEKGQAEKQQLEQKVAELPSTITPIKSQTEQQGQQQKIEELMHFSHGKEEGTEISRGVTTRRKEGDTWIESTALLEVQQALWDQTGSLRDQQTKKKKKKHLSSSLLNTSSSRAPSYLDVAASSVRSLSGGSARVDRVDAGFPTTSPLHAQRLSIVKKADGLLLKVENVARSIQETQKAFRIGREVTGVLAYFFSVISLEFPPECNAEFRFWLQQANSLNNEVGRKGPTVQYNGRMETTRWQLANKILRMTGLISTNTVDPYIVDCEHLQVVRKVASTHRNQTLEFLSPQYRKEFCSLNMTAWLVYTIHKSLSVLKELARGRGLDQAQKRAVPLLTIAADLQGHPDLAALPHTFSKISERIYDT